MQLFTRNFQTKQITIYPIGDWHLGSPQCNEKFVMKVLNEIKGNPMAYWVGMGDLMENAIFGSLGDVYTQTRPPHEQLDRISDLLLPIASKGLFLIAGNHERRTARQVDLIPEQYIATRLNLPFLGFSCLAIFDLEKAKNPRSFSCYFHHNYGGGYTPGGKINKAYMLRKITPTVEAIFSGHFHITSRIPITWFEPGYKQVQERVGYDYIIGSALSWNDSYAEEKAKPAATLEHIKVTFIGCNSGSKDTRQQIYEVILP